jgi:hypothetical protein
MSLNYPNLSQWIVLVFLVIVCWCVVFVIVYGMAKDDYITAKTFPFQKIPTR